MRIVEVCQWFSKYPAIRLVPSRKFQPAHFHSKWRLITTLFLPINPNLYIIHLNNQRRLTILTQISKLSNLFKFIIILNLPEAADTRPPFTPPGSRLGTPSVLRRQVLKDRRGIDVEKRKRGKGCQTKIFLGDGSPCFDC